MIDAEDRLLRECSTDQRVQLAGGREVATERLLDNQASTWDREGSELLDDRRERARRDRQIVEWAPRGPESLAQPAERRRVGVVARDVTEQRRQLGEGDRIQPTVLGDAGRGPRDEIVVGQGGPGR